MLQREHSAILSTFIKIPFVIKIIILSVFEWPFYTGFTVYRSTLPACDMYQDLDYMLSDQPSKLSYSAIRYYNLVKQLYHYNLEKYSSKVLIRLSGCSIA